METSAPKISAVADSDIESQRFDDELYDLVQREIKFQETTINLTAASNYLSPLVSGAMRHELNNIHCEGYPGLRYHEGQEMADAIERLAIKRACALFKADHANVQPYRGTMANMAACAATMAPGDTLLGFACDAGGHFTTGGDVHIIGKLYKVETYSVDPSSGELDYERIQEMALKCNPRVIFSGDTAYTGVWNWQRMKEIADQVGAVLIADVSQTAGLIAAGIMPSPFPYVDVVTTATYKTLRGPRAGLILCKKEYAKKIDRAVFPVCQDGTNIMLIAGLAAALFEAAKPAFTRYCARVLDNAKEMAAQLSAQGYDLIAGGTCNHACLIDLSKQSISGRTAASTLATVNIVCNANQIPFDHAPPRNPSGLRLGTPSITTLGMQKDDVKTIINFVGRALIAHDNRVSLDSLAHEVTVFRQSFNKQDSWSVNGGVQRPLIKSASPV